MFLFFKYSFILVGICLHLQILKFLLLVFANQNEYSFGICPRSKTNTKKWYSSVLTKMTKKFVIVGKNILYEDYYWKTIKLLSSLLVNFLSCYFTKKFFDLHVTCLFSTFLHSPFYIFKYPCNNVFTWRESESDNNSSFEANLPFSSLWMEKYDEWIWGKTLIVSFTFINDPD